ncbi:hypothetical protein [Rhodanobacter hydrolyticus]|uniref:Uncharacterized protein n=1 Tax=Rhodanobacter hydrolyticus TaxID=2250595 RepID=A0ABW8JAI4_9GAMM
MLAIYLGLLATGVVLFVLSYVAPFRVASLMRQRQPQHWEVVIESAKGRIGPLRIWMRMQYVLRSPALTLLGDRDINRWRGIWRYSQWLGWSCWLAALGMRLRWG